MWKSLTITPRLIRAIKIIILAAPIMLFAWLLNQRYIFTPHITLAYRAGTKPTTVVPDTKNIVKTYNSNWQIGTDTLDINVRIPRLVETVRLRAELYNRNQPIIKLTAVGNEEYGDQSVLIRYQTLDNLKWNRVDNHQLHLWQRTERETTETVFNDEGEAEERTIGITPIRQYGSVEEFLTDLPTADKFAVVDLNPYLFSYVPNYQPALSPITIAHALRGAHTMYVYAANEDLRLTFDKRDINRDPDDDALTVKVRKLSYDISEKTLRYKKTVADDGNRTDDSRPGPVQAVTVVVKDLPAGMYRVDFQASDDVLISNIVSDQHYLFFTDRVFLADGDDYGNASPDFRPFKIVTNSSRLTVWTKHAAGLQIVYSGDNAVSMDRIGQKYILDDLPAPAAVDFERGDVLIESSGMITIQPAQLPEFIPAVYAGQKQQLDRYDYLISRYFPQKTTGRVVIDQTFQLNRLLLTTKDLHFRLEFPGLVSADRTVELANLKATLTRGDFPWHKIVEKISKIFSR